MPSATFHKKERLSGEKSFDLVFQNGQVIQGAPLRLIWLVIEKSEKPNVKVGIAVSKRNFKRAVDRNLIKRRIREVYRKKKSVLIKLAEAKSKSFKFVILYTGNKIKPFKIIEQQIEILFEKFIKQVCG